MIYAFGAFELDGARFELRRSGRRVPLAPKAFDLLAYLVQHRDREVSKQELLGALWSDGDVADWSLARALHVVRRALDEKAWDEPPVRTLRGRGYRFTAAVEVLPGGAPARAVAALAGDPFVGRAEPLARLRAALDAAVAGRGGTLFVTGEAGIGKSRLAGEAAAYARSRGAEVLVGRCPEDQGAPAFRPWAQIVRAFAEAREPGALAAVLGQGAADLIRAIPELGERLPGLPPAPALEPAQARLRLFEAMRAFLHSASADRALVLLLDDLHRADELSLRQLAFLAPRVSQARVLVVGTFRDVEAAQDAARGPLLAQLATPERILPLEGLARDDVELLLEQALGVPVPPARALDLHARTAGNPLFLVQLARLLASARQGAGAAAEEPSLPRALRDAIRGQLDTVSEECRELLVVASVIGREFPVPLLAAACDRTPEEAERVLAEAATARVVAPGHDAATLRFAHVVVRDVLYGDLAPAQRVALHRRVARSLEAQSAAGGELPLAELAHHFFEAAPGGDVEAAVGYAVRAAERAAARLAYEEAALHCERALELLDLRGGEDARRRCEVLLALGEARMRVFESRPGVDPKSAREALARAAELAGRAGAPELLARAALAFGGTDDLAGQVLVLDTAHVGLLEEALRALGQEHAGLRVHVLERLAKALYWSDAAERRAELSREAVETARGAGDARSLARAAYGRRWGLRVPEELELQLAAAEETVRLAEAARDFGLLVAGRVWLVHERMAAGDPRGASAEIDEYVRLAGSLRVRLYPAFFFRAALAILEGRFEEGERLGREGLAAAEGSPWAPDAGMSYGTQLALVRTEQGRMREVEPMLKLFVDRYPRLPGWRAGLAALYAEEGRSAEAREQFEILAQHDFADLPRDINWTHTMAVLAETCAHLGDVPRAERLYATLLPHARRAVMVGYATGCWGSPSRWLGLLAETLSRPEEAAHHYEAALAANEAMGARSWVARTRLDAARLLAARERPGDRAAARELVAVARSTAQELGMALVAERASALERALGG